MGEIIKSASWRIINSLIFYNGCNAQVKKSYLTTVVVVLTDKSVIFPNNVGRYVSMNRDLSVVRLVTEEFSVLNLSPISYVKHSFSHFGFNFYKTQKRHTCTSKTKKCLMTLHMKIAIVSLIIHILS